ncbi:hypothetical protein C6497_08310 [Candidatus Poribacteria bacterium]|nr:MAG: hypothetical protein C6497_08310 [Candidatus Poribacteria bacterium]
MANTIDLAKIHGAAFYFAYISRDKKIIAEHFQVSVRTIERWSQTEAWQDALKVWGFTGDTTGFSSPPTRDIARKSRENFDRAQRLYIEALNAGEPDHKIASIVGEATGLPPSTIRRWAKRYNWRQYLKEDSILYLKEIPMSQNIESRKLMANSDSMHNVESITYTGHSGTIYPFEIYRIGTEFPSIGAVYIFTRKIQSKGDTVHDPLYIGQTASLIGRFCDQRIFRCVKKYGGEYICIHRIADEIHRRKIEGDLRLALNAICNV